MGSRSTKASTPRFGAAIESIAHQIGCVPLTLNEWVKRDEIDSGAKAGVTTPDLQRLKEFKRENKEWRKANEILKLASCKVLQSAAKCRRSPRQANGDTPPINPIPNCAASAASSISL